VLCRKIVELCPGAVSIASYEKKEGGFNKVFIITTDNGKRIVARLPTRISGLPRLSANSEVATITYCRSDHPPQGHTAADLGPLFSKVEDYHSNREYH
jgi:hypothetical protein